MKSFILALALALAGCTGELPEGAQTYGNTNLKKLTIEGVDCIVGAGDYDTTVALSCNWEKVNAI